MRNLIASLLLMFPVVTLLPCDVCAETIIGQELLSTQENSSDFLNALPQEPVPLVITAGFELRDINFIDDEAETFNFTGVLTLSWHDPRQAFDPAETGIKERLYTGNFQFNEVYTGWWPQIVLVNESGMYDIHGVSLRISPDGTLTLTEKVNATAKTDYNLRLYPFDTQHLEAVFEVLDFDSNEVLLRTSSNTEVEVLLPDEGFRLSQWHLQEITAATEDRKFSTPGGEAVRSTYVVQMELQRKSLFILRLVVLPMMLIVILSWSVFWMEKSSLGDRISISFIGILTVVAYQMVIGEILPKISYFTLMNAFLNISFILMCTTIFINLLVSFLDKQGKLIEGDQLDRSCRWLFPLIYAGLILTSFILLYSLPPPN